jgi:hypothetical protein
MSIRGTQFFWRDTQKIFFLKKFTWVLLDGFLKGFSKFRFLIVEICLLIWDFWVIFENYIMLTLSIRGNDFIAHWAYEEQIFAHAQPAVKCEQFLHVNLCWAYAERISSHTEHTRIEFCRWLSICEHSFSESEHLSESEHFIITDKQYFNQMPIVVIHLTCEIL